MAIDRIGNLRVGIEVNSAQFSAGLKAARKQLTSFRNDFTKLRSNTLAQVASFGALTLAVKSSIDVFNKYENSNRQLAATAKLTGVNLSDLQSVSKKAQGQFKLSSVAANGFTIELTKLAGKAGDVGQASAGLEAFLDIGAARGLDAAQTLKAVQQSILGIDEGTDKLFSKNPSVLYKEYADSIGTTVGRLTDQQKAQAILNAALQDGAKVRGEYQEWLKSSQGQQYLLSQGIEQTQAALGKALQPVLVAILPHLTTFTDWLSDGIRLVEQFGAQLATLPPRFKMLWGAMTQQPKVFAEAAVELARLKQAAFEIMNPNQSQGGVGYGASGSWGDTPGTSGTTTPPVSSPAGPSLLDVKFALIRIQHSLERRVPDELAKSITRSLAPIGRGATPLLGGSQIMKAAGVDWKDAAKDFGGTVTASLMPRGSGVGGTIGEHAGSALSNALKLGGGLLGNTLLPGVGGLIGSAIGGLFADEKKSAPKVVSSLEAIQRNTKEAITAIEQQTSALLNPQDRLINAPASLAFPDRGGFAMSGDIVINVTTESNASPADIASAISNAFDDRFSSRLSSLLSGDGRARTSRTANLWNKGPR